MSKNVITIVESMMTNTSGTMIDLKDLIPAIVKVIVRTIITQLIVAQSVIEREIPHLARIMESKRKES